MGQHNKRCILIALAIGNAQTSFSYMLKAKNNAIKSVNLLSYNAKLKWFQIQILTKRILI